MGDSRRPYGPNPERIEAISFLFINFELFISHHPSPFCEGYNDDVFGRAAPFLFTVRSAKQPFNLFIETSELLSLPYRTITFSGKLIGLLRRIKDSDVQIVAFNTFIVADTITAINVERLNCRPHGFDARESRAV